MVNFEAIIWYLFLLDSVGANLMSWFFPNWFKKKFRKSWWYKHAPMTKGWTLLYLVLILWIGYSLYRLGLI